MIEPQNQLANRTPSPEGAVVEFVPFGAAESIKLTTAIVLSLVATPTRSGKLPTKEEAMKFMMLCRARHLNPFEGDAFLVGYDSQDGAKFSLLTAHQVFLKRAEASEQFEGMQSGVIVERNKEIVEEEGDFTRKGDILLGGWAKVFRKDRKMPFLRRLKLETFDSDRSRWKIDKAGMIVKCAEADALRSAFPTHLGGLYMPEEREAINVTATVIPKAQLENRPAAPTENKPVDAKVIPPDKAKPDPKKTPEKPAAPKSKAVATTVEQPELTPAPAADKQTAQAGPADELAAKLEAAGFTVAELCAMAVAMDLVKKATSIADLPEQVINDILGDWQTATDTMKQMKGAK